MSINVLFLTVVKIDHVSEKGIYTDLIRQFLKNGDRVTIICPLERRYRLKTRILKDKNLSIIQVRTLNFQKAGFIEKGIATIMMDSIFLKATKMSLKNSDAYDLVLYSTPPITFSNTVRYVKKKCNAFAYLMLKDIFPQNALDIGIIKKNSFFHRYFKGLEEKLYKTSDIIGCMSPMNVDFILKNNPYLHQRTVELCPNAIEISNEQTTISSSHRLKLLNEYGIPHDSVICIYGGNLGKPQGIGFLLEILKAYKNISEVFFLIIGNGTEYASLLNWFQTGNPANAKLIPFLPKEQFDELVQISDIGLVFLDPRFTIPNFPSRILTYMEYSKPILAAIDSSTDLGYIINSEGFGEYVISGDIDGFQKKLNYLLSQSDIRKKMGEVGKKYLEKYFNVTKVYSSITKHLN